MYKKRIVWNLCRSFFHIIWFLSFHYSSYLFIIHSSVKRLEKFLKWLKKTQGSENIILLSDTLNKNGRFQPQNELNKHNSSCLKCIGKLFKHLSINFLLISFSIKIKTVWLWISVGQRKLTWALHKRAGKRRKTRKKMSI